MKKISVFFVIFALCFSAFFNGYSINIDGYDNGSEWEEAESQIILNGESNCKVEFGLIKWIADPEINAIYICILFKEPGIASSNLNAGVSVQTDDSEPFIINAGTSPKQCNYDKYYFDGSVLVDDNGGVTCEARIGFKYGLPSSINGKLRFYDSEGSASNIYYFTIENSVTVTQKHNSNEDSYTEKRTNTPSDKTTVKSNKTTSDSTKMITSTVKNDGNQMKVNQNLLDLLFSSESTTKYAIQTTKTKTTSAVKTTKRSKTDNKTKRETIKETELSSVTESYTETATTAVPSVTEKAEAKKNTAKLDAYKIITIVAGGITLVVISVLGTLKAKKDNNNENDRGS